MPRSADPAQSSNTRPTWDRQITRRAADQSSMCTVVLLLACCCMIAGVVLCGGDLRVCQPPGPCCNAACVHDFSKSIVEDQRDDQACADLERKQVNACGDGLDVGRL